MSGVSYVVACLGIRTFDGNTREGGLETSRLLMAHGYMLSGTGSNVYVQNLCRALVTRVLPASEVAVVPSIFPETFGLVAAEAAASSVPPFVADHSGLREAGAIVGRGLPVDLRVGLKGDFGENLTRALVDYLSLPKEERQGCRETVRRNSVEYLSWDALARQIATLAGGYEKA